MKRSGVLLKFVVAVLFCLSAFVTVSPVSGAGGNRCKDRCNEIYHRRKDECKSLRKWERHRCEERAKYEHDACKRRCR